MPTFRHSTVQVTTDSDKPFAEFGEQYLKESRACSCYIQSEADLTFKIRLQARLPFPWEKYSGNKHATHNMYEERYGNGASQAPHRHGPHSAHAITRPPIPYYDRHSAPYHLLASVYIDGREKPERRAIVYLDNVRHNEDPAGVAHLKSRWVTHSDGSIQSHKWLFKDTKGIDTLLDQLYINGDVPIEGGLDSAAEQDLLAALQNTTMASTGGKDDEKKRGQIRVTLERVVVSKPKEDPQYRPSHETWQEQDEMNDGDQDHVASVDKGIPLSRDPVRVVEYKAYRDDDPYFAVFTFFYRSKEQLRKFHFGLQTQNGSSRLSYNRRLNHQMANLTPLSFNIGNSKTPTSPPSFARSGDRPNASKFSASPSNYHRQASILHSRPTMSTTKQQKFSNTSASSTVTRNGSDTETEQSGDRPVILYDRLDERRTSTNKQKFSSASITHRSADPKAVRDVLNGAEAEDEADDEATDTSRASDRPKRPLTLDEDYNELDHEFPSGKAGFNDDQGIGKTLDTLHVGSKRKDLHRDTSSSPNEDHHGIFEFSPAKDQTDGVLLDDGKGIGSAKKQRIDSFRTFHQEITAAADKHRKDAGTASALRTKSSLSFAPRSNASISNSKHVLPETKTQLANPTASPPKPTKGGVQVAVANTSTDDSLEKAGYVSGSGYVADPED